MSTAAPTAPTSRRSSAGSTDTSCIEEEVVVRGAVKDVVAADLVGADEFFDRWEGDDAELKSFMRGYDAGARGCGLLGSWQSS